MQREGRRRGGRQRDRDRDRNRGNEREWRDTEKRGER